MVVSLWLFSFFFLFFLGVPCCFLSFVVVSWVCLLVSLGFPSHNSRKNQTWLVSLGLAKKNAPTCLRCASGFPLSHAQKGTPQPQTPHSFGVRDSWHWKVKRARLSGFLISKSRTINSTDPILALCVSQGCVAHFFKSNPCQPQVKRSQRNHYIMGEPDRIGEHLTICPNPWQSGCQSLGACCWYCWRGNCSIKSRPQTSSEIYCGLIELPHAQGTAWAKKVLSAFMWSCW